MSFNLVIASFPTPSTQFGRIISKAANSGSMLVRNTDAAVTVYLTDNPTGNPQTVDSAPLAPGDSIVLDGTQDVYCFTQVQGTQAILTVFPSATSAQAGTLAITGNVNATVSGNVNVTNTPSVVISGTPNVNIANSPTVTIGGTPNVTIANASVTINGTVGTIKEIDVLSTTSVFTAGTTTGSHSQAYGSTYEGYLLEVIPQNPGTRIFAVDLLISHLDASSNVLGIEQVTLSNWQNLGNNTSVVRGRLLGTSLAIVAVIASSAWINGVTGGGVTADNIQVRFCGLATYIPNTGKRVPIIQQADGLLLASGNSVSLPATANSETLVAVLADYTGLVVIDAHTFLGGGATWAPVINCYTVSNGTGILHKIITPNVLIAAPIITEVSLPSCFNVAYVRNMAAIATTASFGVTITSPDQ